jgi:hypothetical protein
VVELVVELVPALVVKADPTRAEGLRLDGMAWVEPSTKKESPEELISMNEIPIRESEREKERTRNQTNLISLSPSQGA